MLLGLLLFSACEKVDSSEDPLQNEYVTSQTDLTPRSLEGDFDPIISQTNSETRGNYLSSFLQIEEDDSDGVNGDATYIAEGWPGFIWDIEYITNYDNWNGISMDRDLMEFKRFSYTVESYDENALTTLRNQMKLDVAHFLTEIDLPQAYKWFEVANVSGNNGGDIVKLLVGVGVNLDPCPGPGCPDVKYEHLAELETDGGIAGGGNSTCSSLPQASFFPPTTFEASPLCDPAEFYGALDYAKDFTNRGELINGVLEPAECNPVHPNIFTDLENIPRRNLSEYFQGTFNSDNISFGNCFTDYPMYQYSVTGGSSCSGLEFDCIPGGEARVLMETIGIAIENTIDNVPILDYNSKFYCTTSYVVDYSIDCCPTPPDPTKLCCIEYTSRMGTLWFN